MTFGTFGTSDPRHPQRNRGLDRLRQLRQAPPAVLPGPWPACPSCGRASGWRCSAADPTARCLCGTGRPEPEPDPRCVRCLATLASPEDLLCPACYRPDGPRQAATPTDGVRVTPPSAPEAQLDLLPGEAP